MSFRKFSYFTQSHVACTSAKCQTRVVEPPQNVYVRLHEDVNLEYTVECDHSGDRQNWIGPDGKTIVEKGKSSNILKYKLEGESQYNLTLLSTTSDMAGKYTLQISRLDGEPITYIANVIVVGKIWAFVVPVHLVRPVFRHAQT